MTRLRPNGRCKTCSAPLMWVHTDKGRMPLDVEPAPSGNVVLLANEHCRVLTAAELADRHALPGGPGPLYVSHFATCPQANQHRRRPR